MLTKKQIEVYKNEDATVKELLSEFPIDVGCDMDDVIVIMNIEKEIEKILGRKIRKEEKENFFIQNVLNEEQKKEFFKKYIYEINPYDDCTLINNSQDGIRKIKEAGYNVYCISSAIWPESPWACGLMMSYKIDVLRENFAFDAKNIIMADCKDKITMDVMIDDRSKNLIGKHMNFLFSAPHNENEKIEPSKKVGKNIIKADWILITEKLLDTKVVRKLIYDKYNEQLKNMDKEL